MKIEILQFRVSVELTEEQFDTLLELDFIEVLRGLEALGFFELNYSGHFGPYLYVSYESKDKNMRQKLRHWVRKNLGSP